MTSYKTQVIYVLLLTFFSEIASGKNWQLVWSDEFTSEIGPDWVFETGMGSSGWGNNELQYYRKENASVENGALVITAKKESFYGANYTSVRMKTQHLQYWTYGKIEARVSIPSFQGSWPAFWMLGESISSVGWPSCGEIDVMEHVNTSNEIHGTIHWQDHHDQYANYGAGTPYLGAGYHVYEVQWDAQYIKWFLDGNQFHTVNIENGINGTTEFHHDFFILLNMAVGGNWPGFNVDDAAFPAKMYVDYIRVYQDQITHTGDQNQPVMGSIKLFPNPTSNLLVIQAMGERYAIRDIMGLELSRGDFHNKSASVVTSNYPSGMYYISVYDENAIIGTKIFVVKK